MYQNRMFQDFSRIPWSFNDISNEFKGVPVILKVSQGVVGTF